MDDLKWMISSGRSQLDDLNWMISNGGRAREAGRKEDGTHSKREPTLRRVVGIVRRLREIEDFRCVRLLGFLSLHRKGTKKGPKYGEQNARISIGVMRCDVMWCDVMWCDLVWCDVT